ncbi:MAG: LysM peptidoglycan-binding domain-containing protein [Gloeobacteraceae cyanobacterium ES-bin-144]|nr:LysM peptidoglycan-binding domain-containing protein [Verrucomicrobiales bacterium]
MFAQSVTNPATATSKIEPGLELAVSWKWWVAPAASKDWGMLLPDALVPKTPGSPTLGPATRDAARPETYEVKKGDAIIKIAKKFDMTFAQLKQFNDLKDDLIHIGQILRIPTPQQLLAMAPPPPEPVKETAGKKKSNKTVRQPEPEPFIDTRGEAQLELDNVRLQVFLDREMFSTGAIDGKPGATLQKTSAVYQRTHADAATPELLKSKAEAAITEPYTRYILRVDDFKFITPPKVELVATHNSESTSAKKKSAKTSPPPPPPRSAAIDELIATDFFGYKNAWEFVAERFHCDEAFLRRINPLLKEAPTVGAEFQVPGVIPFEIEKAFDLPLQPAADPQKRVTAAVVLVSRLEIYSDGKLIAVMPLASARPGLSGRGSWTVLDAIPQPRMATKREPREAPKENVAPAGDAPVSEKPIIEPPLEKEQYLAPGPNNPVGILWINLAKSGSTDPLPYGLHGTSIPSKMGALQGIGGLRLTNWDIARAVRLIPAGTALQWKAQ